MNNAIAFDDKPVKNRGFIFQDQISNYNDGGKTPVDIEINYLSTMLNKVKDGGNAIIAACLSGIKNNGVGLGMANTLDILSACRLNLYLSTGYVERRGDEPNPGSGYSASLGQKINGPLGVYFDGLKPGFLKYNTTSVVYIKNIIINIVGSPVEFK